MTKNEIIQKAELSIEKEIQCRVYFKLTAKIVFGRFVMSGDHYELLNKNMIRFAPEVQYAEFKETGILDYTRIYAISTIENIIFY